MGRSGFRPLTFLIAGFGWLLLSSLVGLAILIGLVHGTPLPSWLRMIHVHALLIGGILQLMIGGLLASLSSDSQSSQSSSNSRPGLFATLNAATIVLLLGFGFQDMRIVGGTGIVLIGTVAFIAPVVWQYARHHSTRPTGSSWLYRFSLISLLLGLVISVAMAFQFAQEYYAHLRLLHLHLILLGFVTMALIGATHRLLPIVLTRIIHDGSSRNR